MTCVGSLVIVKYILVINEPVVFYPLWIMVHRNLLLQNTSAKTYWNSYLQYKDEIFTI